MLKSLALGALGYFSVVTPVKHGINQVSLRQYSHSVNETLSNVHQMGGSFLDTGRDGTNFSTEVDKLPELNFFRSGHAKNLHGDPLSYIPPLKTSWTKHVEQTDQQFAKADANFQHKLDKASQSPDKGKVARARYLRRRLRQTKDTIIGVNSCLGSAKSDWAILNCYPLNPDNTVKRFTKTQSQTKAQSPKSKSTTTPARFVASRPTTRPKSFKVGSQRRPSTTITVTR